MVEAYTASWIEIPLSGNCSATEMSKPIRLRGLKSLPVRGKVSNGGVEAYTASWIEILAGLAALRKVCMSKPIRLRGLKYTFIFLLSTLRSRSLYGFVD